MSEKILQLKRNSALFSSREEALAKLQEQLTNAADGSPVLARYALANGNVKTILGIASTLGSGDVKYEIFDTEAANDTVSNAIKDLDSNISAESNKFLTGVTITDGKLTAKTDATFESNDKSIVVSNLDLSVGIDSTDNVLVKGTNGLVANVSLKWDKTTGLQLIGKNNTVITTVPATDFIKDGMLDNVELVVVDDEHPITGKDNGTYIKFTFNTDSGKTEPIYIDVTKFIDIYTAGNGIDITDSEVSVKIKENEPILEVTEDGVAVKSNAVWDCQTVSADGKKLKLARTETCFDNHDAAMASLNDDFLSNVVDGESVLIRYKDHEGDVATIVAICNEFEDTKTLTLIDNEEIKLVVSKAISALNASCGFGVDGEYNSSNLTIAKDADSLAAAIAALDSAVSHVDNIIIEDEEVVANTFEKFKKVLGIEGEELQYETTSDSIIGKAKSYTDADLLLANAIRTAAIDCGTY